jgi:hypothetical protein
VKIFSILVHTRLQENEYVNILTEIALDMNPTNSLEIPFLDLRESTKALAISNIRDIIRKEGHGLTKS